MKNNFSTSCTVIDHKCLCFEKLNEEEQKLVEDNSLIVNYKKGETICKQGSFASHVMVVEEGLAKVFIEGEGNSLILKIIPEGNLLGLTSVSDSNNTFQYSAVAYVDSTVKLIDINIFKQLIGTNAKFALDVINILSTNCVQIYGRFFCLTNKQSYGRLADILLCLSERIFNKYEFDLKLTRKDLAELSGMSTENVIRMLKRFKDEGLIEIDRKTLSIKEIEKLRNISKTG